jgi:hypothetical protein
MKITAQKTVLLQVRVLPADLAVVRQRAAAENQSLAEYVRSALDCANPPLGGKREGAGRTRKAAKKK